MSDKFAIVRVGKIKDAAALVSHSKHVLRTIPTPNSDGRQNGVVRLFGNADPEKTVKDAIGQLKKPPRKGAVLALEVLLTASPGWLREGLPPGQYHLDRAKALARAARDWCSKTFPGCPMVAHLHLDESTPHIHVTVVPIDQDPSAKGKSTGPRLNAAKWVDGPDKLRKIQDSWAEALAQYGLKRGIASDRRHKKIRTMYREIEKDRTLAAEDRAAAHAERKAAEKEKEEAHQLKTYLEQLVDKAIELRAYLTDAGKLAAARLRTQMQQMQKQKRDPER